MQRWMVASPVVAAVAVCLGSTGAWAQSQYYFDPNYTVTPTVINYETCGQTINGGGCFGGGGFGPFGQVCAVLSGPEKHSNATTIEQKIYVFDSAFKNKNDLGLYVFKRTVVFSNLNMTSTVVEAGHVKLPLTGGASVTCLAAANKDFIAASTTASTSAVVITKKTLAVATLGGDIPPINAASISADGSGYIEVNFGTTVGNQSFYLLGPSGQAVSFGGGSYSVFPSDNAFIP
jgi:hypothetical protein